MNWFSSFFGKREEDVAQDVTAPADVVLAPPPSVETRDRPLPRFRGTAADQLRSGTRLHDRIRLQLRQAFTPARPIMNPAMLAGRTDLLRTMIRAIEDQYLHVILFGPRGIGKTSLLHVLCGIAQESRYVVRYISCGERTSFDGLFRSVMADVPLLFHANYDPTAAEIEEGLSFADLLDDRPVTVDRASDILGKVAGTRLLIVLDEFDRAGDADFRRSVAELIKNVSDRGSRVQLVIAGVAQNLTEIVEHVPSIRRNILGLRVPNMTPDDIAELISNGQQASGMTFTPKALQLISLAALGLPYLASLVGQHAGFAALDRQSTTIDHTDVDRGIGQVLDHLDLRIAPDVRQRMEQALRAGQEHLLGRLAQVALANSFRLPSDEIDRELNNLRPGNPANTAEALAALKDQYRLLTAVSDDPTGALSFVDDGVPLYLWVRLMHGHSRGNRAG
ncbi:ATP-binding protein [Sphingomonas sp. IC-11]|uniref:nSTAND1 domain-containing NTPase n=1 Tax=Sphingomonas sp. IC-11 TaxID=2898528 RepID=UPI001E5459FE|nr:AAA family ATPase [Sphingomonas sp. IC-11]MCD2316188.1 ATP-binding protein [Sphingomonas sp. IC-11]